jgi:hypothetical protein
MEAPLDKPFTSFGKNPRLTFGQHELVIRTHKFWGADREQRIPLQDIQAIEYVKPLHLGNFLVVIPISIISIFTLSDFPDLRAYLKITYRVEGEQAQTSCNGWYTKREVKAMIALLQSKA